MIFEIIILLALVGLSGVFSSTEIAMFSISEVKLRHILDKKLPNAHLFKRLKEDNHTLLITILIGNNLVNIASAAFATSLAIQYFGNSGVAIATGVMTLLVLTFGEIIPKALATKHSIRISLTMAPMMSFLKKIFYPLVWVFDRFTAKILPANDFEEPLITEEEVRGLVKMSEEEGSIKRQEEEMIQNIFNLDDTYTEDIMTPRPDIYALEDTLKVKEIITDIKNRGYSRIPVYHDDFDNVIGILYAKDLLSANPEEFIKNIIRPAFFVPETKRIDALLREFKQKKIHLALVVNEHGTNVGLVTIEDLIEEIVGEIYDETDRPEDNQNPVKKIQPNHFLMQGKAEVDDVEKALGITLDDEESSTLSGFIMNKLSRIPVAGDRFMFKSFQFTVKKVLARRVDLVEILRK